MSRMEQDRNEQPRRHRAGHFALPLLLAWCVMLVLGSLPAEITPKPLAGLTEAVQSNLQKLSIRAGSFVFSGGRGVWKRRFFGLRVVAWHPDGTSTILFESPEGLVYDPVRVTVPLPDTVSFKMLDFVTMSNLMSQMDPDKRAPMVTALRHSGRSQRVAEFFCESSLYDAANPRARVHIEVYDSAVNFKTGELLGRKDTVFHQDCVGSHGIESWPEPSATPDWPGVVWN